MSFFPNSSVVLGRAFTLDAAEAISGGVDDDVANLVAKSPITADAGGAVVQYRLLETTRAYGLGKLKEAVSPSCSRGVTPSFLRICSSAQNRMGDTYGGQIENIRTALDWAFSPAGAT
jgi:hypothetical protein